MSVIPYFLSWLINSIIIVVIVAGIDQLENLGIEEKPWFGYAVLLLPVLMELASYLLYQKPFLQLIFRGFSNLFG
jgi:hypothetical protein